MRINKYLAECGYASRRKSDDLIKAGIVLINDKLIENPGFNVDPDQDIVSVNGVVIEHKTDKYTYLMLNKPKGCVCTASDEKNRKTIFDYVKNVGNRLFSIGRLDYDTEGLLILTNDGELTHRLTHPSFEIEKVYLVKINNDIAEEQLAKLRKGVVLDDGYKTLPAKVSVLEYGKDYTKLKISIREGKNKQVRRMFAAVNKDVIFLKRVQFGEIKLRGLSRGGTRELTQEEVNSLKVSVGLLVD